MLIGERHMKRLKLLTMITEPMTYDFLKGPTDVFTSLRVCAGGRVKYKHEIFTGFFLVCFFGGGGVRLFSFSGFFFCLFWVFF